MKHVVFGILLSFFFSGRFWLHGESVEVRIDVYCVLHVE